MLWNVPIYSQRTISLCWEACGRMMWDWHHRNNPHMLGAYAMAAGNYRVMNQGLTSQQMDAYYKRLGLRALPNPQGKNIRHALQWSPVIVTSVDQAFGHAMIVSGHSNKRYVVINPCAQQTVDFGSNRDSCTAGALQIPEAEIDGKLGALIWYW